MATEGSAFAPGVRSWRSGLGKVRDAVRQELVAHQLAAHLPDGSDRGEITVLDVGCGQGTQAIRLARAGCRVTGVDMSDDLLDAAAAAVASEPPGVRDRVRLVRADLLDLPESLQGPFDVVCCHGVLMYLPDLQRGIDAVVGAACPGGIVSVLTRNRAGIAMRAGMSQDWTGALAGFDARLYRNRLGLDDVRADEPDEIKAALLNAGAERVAWYGVRVFTDHWGPSGLPDDFDALVAAEKEAGRRDPYRSVAALTHTIAQRATGR